MAFLRQLKVVWVGFQAHAITLLRALGLNILICWLRSLEFRRVKRKNLLEPPKIAIRKNRLSALLRALVHALPVAAALGLVTINLYRYYVGSSIQPLAFYQVIAKIHEIMIQASLAAIVFSYIRHEMVLGQGIPLGAMFSGLQLSQSIELYLRLVNNAMPRGFETVYDEAPNSVQVTGKASLRHLKIGRQIWLPFVNSDNETIVATAEQAAVADALTATGDLWQTAIGNVNTGGHGVPFDQLDAIQSITTNYYQPYTIASCAEDTIEGPSDKRPLAFPITPGVLPQNLPEQQINNSLLSNPAFSFLDVTRAEMLDTAGSLRETRLRWIELPQDPFNGSAIGAVVLLPDQNPRPEESRHQQIVVCNLAAGWGPSTLNMSSSDNGSTNVQSVISDSGSVSRRVQSLPGPTRTTYAPAAEMSADSNFFVLPIYPKRQMNVSLSWSQYLNPFVSDLNTTVFHQLMKSNLTNRDPAVSARVILSSLLANGLARIGIESSLQGNLKMANNSKGKSVMDSDAWFRGQDAFIVDPQESKDWVKLQVQSTFEGYAYNTSGTGPKISIVFLSIYCAFAIAHTCYAGISGISSTCWDSIGEVTALAMNSAPTTLLRNTSAGLADSKVYRLPARIFAKSDDAGEGEHLELVLGEQDEKTVEQRTIKVNRVYG
ncbi:MAG: hypothetical protein Q9191_005234 [Dirinaria sp. TL-2023a]